MAKSLPPDAFHHPKKACRGARSAGTRARLPLTRSRSGISPMHRTASFPIHLVKQPSFFSPGSLNVRVLFLASQLPVPDRGDGGAPGGGILYPVARVIARRHVCEAWAVPRNRDGASRRSTVTVLGPLRARLRSCLRLARAIPNLPGTAYGPRPGRHLPLRLQDRF